MEYPTLVTTFGDSVFARPGMRLGEYTTVHEVGHNWFQGILASNEAVEAWLDEGVNEWADSKVLDELYGPRTSGLDWMGWQAGAAALQRAIEGDDAQPAPITTAAFAFPDTSSYGVATYLTTARALQTIEGLVGSARMTAAMKAYATRYAFTHPTGRDLFETLQSELHEDLSWFIAPVFGQVGKHDVSIRSAECTPAHQDRGVFDNGATHKTYTEVERPDTAGFSCEVVVQNLGNVHVPIDIELRFADGTSERRRWDDRGAGAWERLVVQRSSRLVEVRLDPDGVITLDAPVAHARRLEGDGAAAMRAAARAASWAQTAMELIGP